MATKPLYELYITNKTKRFSLKWVCHTGGKAFKRRLACNITVLIVACNNFAPLLKHFSANQFAEMQNPFKNIFNAYALP